MKKRIVLAGAGSGGHLLPLVAVKKYLEKEHGKKMKLDFLFLGPEGQMEKEIMDHNEIPRKKVISGKLYRYFTFRYFIDIFRLPVGFVQALWHLLFYMPDVVFSKGGFASVPIVMAARLYGIPVLLHESDAQPGLASRFLGSISSRIAITFERAEMHFPPSRTFVTGNPINPDTVGGSEGRAREILKMKKVVKPIILVLGGSQGARNINNRILRSLVKLIQEYQIIHQTGVNNFNEVVQDAERQGFKTGHSDYYPIPFLKSEFKHMIALADIVVSRSGSTAIAEIAANQKASILVPLSTSANDHQRINAFEVAKKKGAIVLEESNFRENLLLRELRQITENKDGIADKMRKEIARFYHPEATGKIANEILEMVK